MTVLLYSCTAPAAGTEWRVGGSTLELSMTVPMESTLLDCSDAGNIKLSQVTTSAGVGHGHTTTSAGVEHGHTAMGHAVTLHPDLG